MRKRRLTGPIIHDDFASDSAFVVPPTISQPYAPEGKDEDLYPAESPPSTDSEPEPLKHGPPVVDKSKESTDSGACGSGGPLGMPRTRVVAPPTPTLSQEGPASASSGVLPPADPADNDDGSDEVGVSGEVVGLDEFPTGKAKYKSETKKRERQRRKKQKEATASQSAATIGNL